MHWWDGHASLRFSSHHWLLYVLVATQFISESSGVATRPWLSSLFLSYLWCKGVQNVGPECLLGHLIWSNFCYLTRSHWRKYSEHFPQVLRKFRRKHPHGHASWSSYLRNQWVKFRTYNTHELTPLKSPQVLFGMVYWAKKKKYKEDESLLIKKLYRDAFLYYLLLIGEFFNTHVFRGVKG